jgi:hypothetical protein
MRFLDYNKKMQQQRDEEMRATAAVVQNMQSSQGTQGQPSRMPPP